MNRRTFCAILPVAGTLRTAGAASSQQPRERLLFDHDWKFLLGDPEGAGLPSYDAGAWRTLDVPHDWSIEGKIDPQSPMGGSGGFFPAGVGWYRKTFTVSSAWNGKKVSVDFEGVYMNATVSINGHDLGMHPYGYTSFSHDLTPHLKPGANLLAVRVDQSQQRNSRWYSGSGIYRHVWFNITDPIHVAPWGVCVTTPEASAAQARVSVRTRIANESPGKSNVALQTVLYAASGAAVGQSNSTAALEPGNSIEVSQEIAVARPALWETESPVLYRAVTQLVVDSKTVDEVSTPFGIRSLDWSAEKGFLLNGKALKMTGGCVHHDNGPLGAAAFDRAEERRVQILKQAGFTAIRCSHNPPSPAFLDACDRLGMLVLDEAFDHWEVGKNPQDYHLYFKDWWKRDLDWMVLRDRNHPSVILWSIGNEIPERADPRGVEIAKMLTDEIRRLDATRPITAAVPDFWEAGKPRKWEESDAAFQYLNVAGYNYKWKQYEPDHARRPDRVMLGTESFPFEAFQNWQMVE